MFKRDFIFCLQTDSKIKIDKALFLNNKKFWLDHGFKLVVFDTDHKLVLFDFELSNKKRILEGGANMNGRLVEVEAYNELLIYNFALWLKSLTPKNEEVYVYTPAIKEDFLILDKNSTIDDLIKEFGVDNYI